VTSNRLAPGLSLVAVFVLAAWHERLLRLPVERGDLIAPPSTGAPPPAGSGGPAAGQTDTEWGRIWDTLPSGFPTYPGSTPGEETATGPASADLVVDGIDAKGIVTLLQTLLQRAGYETVGLSGPLEDGSYVLEMTGSATGCKVRIGATPTGGLTTITILYGAACPHD
jgi:hypothetical protein